MRTKAETEGEREAGVGLWGQGGVPGWQRSQLEDDCLLPDLAEVTQPCGVLPGAQVSCPCCR